MTRSLIFFFSALFVMEAASQNCHLSRNNNNNNNNKAYLAGPMDRWPDATVPYYIDPYFTDAEKDAIRQAVDDIEAVSCAKFKELEEEPSPPVAYVHIQDKEEGCSCMFGYVKGRKSILNLNRTSNCVNPSTATHELLHALGAQHEQKRPDRDNFIRINWQNIQPDQAFNFWRTADVSEQERPPPKCDDGNNATDFDGCFDGTFSDTFGLDYDFDSIMHYGPTVFSIDDSLFTMERVDGNPLEDNRAMSDLDIQKLRAAYKCP